MASWNLASIGLILKDVNKNGRGERGGGSTGISMSKLALW